MHHATKKSLVAKYSELKAGGATEDALREAMSTDEKIESKEDADEIIAALETAGNDNAPAKSDAKYFVKKDKSFRDKNNFSKEFVGGDDVSHLETDRLEHLVKIGYVETK